MDSMAFLGTGMKFPPQINKGSGRFAVSSGAANVKESIYIILMTHMGERWIRPAFGSQLMSYTFMDTSPTMLNMLSAEIRNAILTHEPRVADVDVDFGQTKAEGCLLVNIGYSLHEANSRDNMVFPFYLGLTDKESADE